MPAPGRYAVAVHHDLNANGERDRQDGGGYSRNPKVSLLNPKPAFSQGGLHGRQRSGAGRRDPALRQGPWRGAGGKLMTRPRIALRQNPKSTGNLAQLPRIRAFCAEHPDIFHYEVERADQIGEAMATIARIQPAVLVINGGDGTVQAALTELYNGGHFGDDRAAGGGAAERQDQSHRARSWRAGRSGRGAGAAARDRPGRPRAAHRRARADLRFRAARPGSQPVIGMFLGGAGLADIMLYCRERIYPLGLPNGVSHVITAVAVVLRQVFGLRASFLPPEPALLSVSLRREGAITGRFALLFVTTLEKLLLSGEVGSNGNGPLKFVAVEQKPMSMLRAFVASLVGRLGRTKLAGVHVEEADEISIEGEASQVILDGETFRAGIGKPILLRPAPAACRSSASPPEGAMADALRDLVEAELGQPVDPRVTAMAEAIAARHGAASRAVLFYGSCLREKQLDGLMLDFYLIVSDYRAAYDKRWLAKANALIPPNVFPFQHDGLAAKYAVLSEADFHRLNGPETRNVSVWARFAQPSRLVWARNDEARGKADRRGRPRRADPAGGGRPGRGRETSSTGGAAHSR